MFWISLNFYFFILFLFCHGAFLLLEVFLWLFQTSVPLHLYSQLSFIACQNNLSSWFKELCNIFLSLSNFSCCIPADIWVFCPQHLIVSTAILLTQTGTEANTYCKDHFMQSVSAARKAHDWLCECMLQHVQELHFRLGLNLLFLISSSFSDEMTDGGYWLHCAAVKLHLRHFWWCGVDFSSCRKKQTNKKTSCHDWFQRDVTTSGILRIHPEIIFRGRWLSDERVCHQCDQKSGLKNTCS